MTIRNVLSSVLSAALLCACAQSAPPEAAPALTVDAWSLPAPEGSAQPDLVQAADGALLLGWIRRLEQGHALEMARLSQGAWGDVRRIAEGQRWFVNWADTPHLVSLPDGSLWAHWLQRSGDGPYDYGIALVRSADDGATWDALPSVHPTDRPLDFGFVSLWAAADDRLGIAWLDSRNKSVEAGHDHHGGHGDDDGAMALFATEVSAEGLVARSRELDASTCDCCQTAVARSGEVTLLAYRSRREGEIRDIEVVRETGAGWEEPRLVHADGWRIPGCPVNGPAIAAHGDHAWVAWYSEDQGEPVVRLARSEDAGRTFHTPLEWRRGTTQLGRVAVAADADAVWWAWMEEASGQQSVWVARGGYGLATDHIQAVRVAPVTASGRASGFPRLQLVDGIAHLVWTDVVDGRPRLSGARIQAQ
ncbi:sialidase family protein [Alkalisalibacterium limincola]|uniref:Exo-alpha-sialidase n=1 Tax=Alkalisalibacterium limincola TaxID=2699169 RepID=A0A5C8KH80_9GAMM|nr:sialidase family protein [Alkalisalibacterium limincola]TXK59815.1 exo-alpha-sialidase [Alkalisalibacterium limincola]